MHALYYELKHANLILAALCVVRPILSHAAAQDSLSLQVLCHIDHLQPEQKRAESAENVENACGTCERYSAAAIAAMSGRSLDMHSDDLLVGVEADNTVASSSYMHGGHACLLLPFAQAVAAAWAASTLARGTEPMVTDGNDPDTAQRAKRAQQARQQAPHVQAALTFVLMLCMAALGREVVDRDSQLLSSILLV